jgi:pilus assembly protein Flp/PilA
MVLETLRIVLCWLQTRINHRDDTGATLVEYGLLVALIAVVALATLTLLGIRINYMFCLVLRELGGTASC